MICKRKTHSWKYGVLEIWCLPKWQSNQHGTKNRSIPVDFLIAPCHVVRHSSIRGRPNCFIKVTAQKTEVSFCQLDNVSTVACPLQTVTEKRMRMEKDGTGC